MNNKTIKLLSNGSRHFLQHRPLNSSTEIRLTRLCTQRCRQCQIYERKTKPANMSLAKFCLVADRLKEYGSHIGFISGGEATLVPDLEEILLHAQKTFSFAVTLVSGLYHKTETILRIAQVCLDNDINIQTSLDGLGEIGAQLRGVRNFSNIVLKHMEMISNMRKNSNSLLYVNIVLSDPNLEQVPELIQHAKNLGWHVTIGLYHHSTETTRTDDDLVIKIGPRLDTIIRFLDHHPDILNLNAFIRGIMPYLENGETTPCPFVASRFLSTRTTIMENGDVHLCWGGPIGNIYNQSLDTIFSSPHYHERLKIYSSCRGCWTTCYTQRYLLVHPGSVREWIENIQKMRRLRKLQTGIKR